MAVRVYLVALTLVVCLLSVDRLAATESIVAVVYFLVWGWLASEDQKRLSVPTLWLAIGVAAGILLLLSRVENLYGLRSMAIAVASSFALAIVVLLVGAICSRLAREKALGDADPYALFALTLPLTQQGVLLVLIGALPFGLLLRQSKSGCRNHVPFITVIVICVFNVIIFEWAIKH